MGEPVSQPILRDEQPDDIEAIHDLTAAAFRDMVFSDGDEQHLVRRLRDDGDLVLSIVATARDGTIVGHIAFSPIAISDGARGWYQLAPVSVLPESQRTGIGSLLVRAGLDRMRRMGAAGIALVGDPEYYARFGFSRDHALTLSDALDRYLQCVCWVDPAPRGRISLAPAFG